MNKLKLFLITVIGLSSFFDIANAKVVICYYGTWANYRSGDGRFVPEDIDPSLCTHINYAFFGITPNGTVRLLDEWLDISLAVINRTVALKEINPKLKVIAAVGGWNEGSENYSHMAANAASRQTFIDSTLAFILEHGFDGLDLDWEYPAQRGGIEEDKANFVTLLKEIKNAFREHNLELSIAVGASESTANLSYNIKSIAKHVNYINLMTYDYTTGDAPVVGFNAPLKGQGNFNVKGSVKYWLKKGAPAHKLVAGLAFYGHTFTLSNSEETAVGSNSSGPGTAGPYTQSMGVMGYHEICSLVPTWSYNWAEDYGVPYIHKEDQWIGYDNVESIQLKMDYIKSMNLAGAMLWSIETDDFHGNCGETYPLLKAINRKFNKIV